MNTNSKHYELLAIEPWDIMEANFPPEQFVSYLKGNIIKYTLRDKGQALTDAEKIKHYAEKLIEVLETKENGDIVTGELLSPVYTPKAEPKEPEVKHKFKVGDRVRVSGFDKEISGVTKEATVVALKTTFSPTDYLVALDAEGIGWTATKEKHGVDAENVWLVPEESLELLEEEPKKTLKPNKWYDAEDFTVEELKELLPVGTKVIITFYHDNDRKVTLEYEDIRADKVEKVMQRNFTKETRIAVESSDRVRRYFKIVEEN